MKGKGNFADSTWGILLLYENAEIQIWHELPNYRKKEERNAGNKTRTLAG